MGFLTLRAHDTEQVEKEVPVNSIAKQKRERVEVEAEFIHIHRRLSACCLMQRAASVFPFGGEHEKRV